MKPWVLCSIRAWEETSMTTASTPASAISLKIFCRVRDSGVVLAEGILTSPYRVSIVPIRPTLKPALCRMDRTI